MYCGVLNNTTEPIHRYAKELHLYTGPAATHCTLAGVSGVCPPAMLLSLEGKSAIFRFHGFQETAFNKCGKYKEVQNTMPINHSDLSTKWAGNLGNMIQYNEYTICLFIFTCPADIICMNINDAVKPRHSSTSLIAQLVIHPTLSPKFQLIIHMLALRLGQRRLVTGLRISASV